MLAIESFSAASKSSSLCWTERPSVSAREKLAITPWLLEHRALEQRLRRGLLRTVDVDFGFGDRHQASRQDLAADVELASSGTPYSSRAFRVLPPL